MALTVSSFNSNSVNTLFSSMNAGNNKNNSFGSLTSSLSDYNLIRSGSYFKLMKSYFADPSLSSGVASSAVSKFKDTSISNPADLKETVKTASALSDDALALRDKSLYEAKTVTDEDGNESKYYDYDKIASSLSDFVSSYNSFVDNAKESNTSGVLSSAASMVKYTSANRNMLSKVGISIGSDNTLSFDKEAFKKADISTVKSLFGSVGGYGYQVAALSSNAKVSANTALSTTYGASGKHNYVSGSTYSSFV